MERLVTIAWLLLAAAHALPAAVLFAPDLVQRLDGVTTDGDVGLLLLHRGALFGAVLVVALYAAFTPDARRAASLVTTMSVVGFLLIYMEGGRPAGPLRTIALVDAAALLPLGLVTWRAWAG